MKYGSILITTAQLALDNAVLSPHMASAGDATRVAMAGLAIDNVRRRLAGKPLLAERCPSGECALEGGHQLLGTLSSGQPQLSL